MPGPNTPALRRSSTAREMPTSGTGIEHYFFGGGLGLRVSTALCWRWFYRPILSDHVAASRGRGVQTAKRADVGTRRCTAVPEHTIYDILGARKRRCPSSSS